MEPKAAKETRATLSKVSRRRSGFTLLELSVVIVIIAVVAGGIAPSVGRWKDGAELRQFYSRVASLADEGREVARSRRTALQLTVSGRSLTLRSGVTEESEGTAVRTLALPNNVNLSSAGRGGNTESTEGFVISYFADGTSDGGTLTFTADGVEQVLRVSSQGRTRWISSDEDTGTYGTETWPAGDLEVRTG